MLELFFSNITDVLIVIVVVFVFVVVIVTVIVIFIFIVKIIVIVASSNCAMFNNERFIKSVVGI
jgi:hypothetical protein